MAGPSYATVTQLGAGPGKLAGLSTAETFDLAARERQSQAQTALSLDTTRLAQQRSGQLLEENELALKQLRSSEAARVDRINRLNAPTQKTVLETGTVKPVEFAPAIVPLGLNTSGTLPASVTAPVAVDGDNIEPLPASTQLRIKFRPLWTQLQTEYGLPDGYLETTAGLESSFQASVPNAAGSSAQGLFQFMPATAQQYGLTNVNDPQASSVAAAKLAKDNFLELQRILGRPPTGAELYLAHQQGARGAGLLIKHGNVNALRVLEAVYQNSNNPALAAESALKKNGGTTDMSAAEFANLWTSKYTGRLPLSTQVLTPVVEQQPVVEPVVEQQPAVVPVVQRNTIENPVRYNDAWDWVGEINDDNRASGIGALYPKGDGSKIYFSTFDREGGATNIFGPTLVVDKNTRKFSRIYFSGEEGVAESHVFSVEDEAIIAKLAAAAARQGLIAQDDVPTVQEPRELTAEETQFAQDIDKLMRGNEIAVAISQIKGRMSTGTYGPTGTPLGRMVGYFTDSPAEAARRKLFDATSKWMYTEGSRFLTANPDLIPTFAADPVGSYQRLILDVVKAPEINPEEVTTEPVDVSGRVSTGDLIPVDNQAAVVAKPKAGLVLPQNVVTDSVITRTPKSAAYLVNDEKINEDSKQLVSERARLNVQLSDAARTNNTALYMETQAALSMVNVGRTYLDGMTMLSAFNRGDDQVLANWLAQNFGTEYALQPYSNGTYTILKNGKPDDPRSTNVSKEQLIIDFRGRYDLDYQKANAATRTAAAAQTAEFQIKKFESNLKIQEKTSELWATGKKDAALEKLKAELKGYDWKVVGEVAIANVPNSTAVLTYGLQDVVLNGVVTQEYRITVSDKGVANQGY